MFPYHSNKVLEVPSLQQGVWSTLLEELQDRTIRPIYRWLVGREGWMWPLASWPTVRL